MALLKAQYTRRRRATDQPPRSRAFFLELLLNMLIFALCAAVTLQVYAQAKLIIDESAALGTLTLEARNLAGYYKVTNGDVTELIGVLDGFGEQEGNSVVYYYNSAFQLSTAEGAYYCLVASPVQDSNQLVSTIEIRAFAIKELFDYDQARLYDRDIEEKELFCFNVVNYQGNLSRQRVEAFSGQREGV